MQMKKITQSQLDTFLDVLEFMIDWMRENESQAVDSIAALEAVALETPVDVSEFDE